MLSNINDSNKHTDSPRDNRDNIAVHRIARYEIISPDSRTLCSILKGISEKIDRALGERLFSIPQTYSVS